MKTREEIEAMSDEERRIKTAELCGWSVYNEKATIDYMWAPGHISTVVPKWINSNNDGRYAMELPDYLNSLDAMHEAERVMDDCECEYYEQSIREIDWEGDGYLLSPIDNWVIHATARARNTAFLMVMLP